MLARLFRARRGLPHGNLALRQQLVVLKRRRARPSLDTFGRLYWVVARRVWSGWKQSLIIVSPETGVRWHGVGTICYFLEILYACQPLENAGGDDGTRTRDLMRDRHAF